MSVCACAVSVSMTLWVSARLATCRDNHVTVFFHDKTYVASIHHLKNFCSV